jgi:copper chaperone
LKKALCHLYGARFFIYLRHKLIQMKYPRYLFSFLLIVLSYQISIGEPWNPGLSLKSEYQKSIRSVEIIVGGMSCQKGCADGIDKKLKTIDGIIKSRTKIETGICKVTFDEQKIQLDRILKIIEERGYTAKLSGKKAEGN